jgi:hypothetical protein
MYGWYGSVYEHKRYHDSDVLLCGGYLGNSNVAVRS